MQTAVWIAGYEATRFLRICFGPEDWVALFLKGCDRARPAQRIGSLAWACRGDVREWLCERNAAHDNVYASANALVAGACLRTRVDVAAVRHVFLDVDQDAPGVLRQLEQRSDLPSPSYVLHTSPERAHILWRARDFDPVAVERLQKRLAADVGGDLAATSVTQMTRLPGFWNHKSREPYRVWVEYRDVERVYTPRDFPSADDAEPVRPARVVTGCSVLGYGSPADRAQAWLASEGNASDSIQNRLIHVDPRGHVLAEIALPPAILACRAATSGAVARRTLGSGFEGITVIPGPGQRYRLAVAQQRGWNYTTPECEALDDDGGGVNALGEPNFTRIWIYDPSVKTWSFVSWELAPLSPLAAWTGLSEITMLQDGGLLLVERDNLTGNFAGLKTLVRIPPGADADGVIGASEKSTYDLLPHLRATRGWITDKVEGVAVTQGGRIFVSTDNDGVDGWSGETWFFSPGRLRNMFD